MIVGKVIVFMSSREVVNYHKKLLDVDLSKHYVENERHIDMLDAPLCGMSSSCACDHHPNL